MAAGGPLWRKINKKDSPQYLQRKKFPIRCKIGWGFGPQKPSFDGRSGILLVRLLYLFWLSGFIYAEPRLQQCAVCSGAGADCSSDADCAAADRVFDRYVYHLQKVFTYNDGPCYSSSVFIPGFDGQSGFVLWGGCSSGDPVLSVAFFD